MKFPRRGERSVGYRADPGRLLWNAVGSGGLRVSDFLLYGLNAAGETVFSETLNGCDRSSLHEIAGQRLRDWHAIEVWEGPMCVLRMQRTEVN
jgi:hypothetical protein